MTSIWGPEWWGVFQAGLLGPHWMLSGVACWLNSAGFEERDLLVQTVDELLWRWDSAYGALLRAEARYEAGGCSKRPTHRAERCGGPGD